MEALLDNSLVVSVRLWDIVLKNSFGTGFDRILEVIKSLLE